MSGAGWEGCQCQQRPALGAPPCRARRAAAPCVTPPRLPRTRAGIPGGRRPFHGERELYQSDHTDLIHSATILGRCVVHSLDDYRVRGREGGLAG